VVQKYNPLILWLRNNSHSSCHLAVSPLIDLYLLPFGPLRESFTARELEEVADLMANRKVRIRVGMESFLETWRGEGESEEDEDGRALEGEMGEDERLLVRAQEERARLMPY
jgi:hypothetical protein